MGFNLDWVGYIEYGKTWLTWLAATDLANEINILIYLLTAAMVVRVIYKNFGGGRETNP